MLLISRLRVAFGTADEIRSLIKRLKLPGTLHEVAGGDHSLKVPKTAGIAQQKV